MPTLAQLGHLLTACRVTTPQHWQRAAKLGAGGLAKTLDALASDAPEWGADAPGLTEYQRGVIELWFEEGGPPPHRQLAVNRFVLLDKLGQGGQGEVYRARQLNPARFVAVKTLTQDTDAGRERFEQEAKALMRVQHPGVARFYLYERVRGPDGNPTYEYLIAMEYVEGTDLHRLGQWIGPVPWPFVAHWAVDLLGGLAVIHEAGLIHRDIKPANVMAIGPLPEPGVAPAATAAKLLDFGAVKPTEDDGPRAAGSRRVFVGTREYAPPEQWRERVVPASDLYALGGTLFHALTSRPPYEIEGRDAVAFMKAHTRAPVPSVREHAPDVPAALDALLTRMLAKDPDDRGTATGLLDEFRALVPSGARPPAVRPTGSPPPPRATKPSALAPRPAPRTVVEETAGDPSFGGSVLAALERVFMPARLRPLAGHEPPAIERLAALARRPIVLLALLALLSGLIFLVFRA